MPFNLSSPVFNEKTFFKAKEVKGLSDDLAARAVGAAPAKPDSRPVAGGNDVFDADVNILKRVHGRDDLPEALRPVNLMAVKSLMVEVIGRNHFCDATGVSGREDLDDCSCASSRVEHPTSIPRTARRASFPNAGASQHPDVCS